MVFSPLMYPLKPNVSVHLLLGQTEVQATFSLFDQKALCCYSLQYDLLVSLCSDHPKVPGVVAFDSLLQHLSLGSVGKAEQNSDQLKPNMNG